MTTARTALITGGTGGIGAAVATALAHRGHRLLVTGRDETRGRAAERQLLRAGAPEAAFLATDHASLEATQRLIAQVRQHTTVLDVLVANAAAMPLTRTRTGEGLDLEVAVDVVGTVALIDGLVPLLAAAPRARIVLVTSDAATRYRGDLADDPWQPARGGTLRAYARAKCWKLHLAAALAEEMRDHGITVHAASPGPAWTPMTRSLTCEALGVPVPVWWLIRLVQRAATPARAAGCIVDAATNPRHEYATGTLIRGKRASGIPVAATRAREALVAARHQVACAAHPRLLGASNAQSGDASCSTRLDRSVTP